MDMRDLFHGTDKLNDLCESKLWDIVRMSNEVSCDGMYDIYLLCSYSSLTWEMCHGFIRVELEADNEWTYNDTLTIPFDWLDMSDAELMDVLRKEKGERDKEHEKNTLDRLINEAEELGYTIVKEV